MLGTTPLALLPLAMPPFGGATTNETITQTITLSQTIALDRFITNETITQSITLTPITPVVSTLIKTLNQNITFSQAIDLQTVLNEDVTQSITLTHHIVKILVRTLTQSITFSQTISVSHSIHISQTLDLGDNIDEVRDIILNVRPQFITFNDNLQKTFIPVPPAQTIIFNQIVRRGANASLTQSITFTQSTPVVHRIYNKTVHQSITFNQLPVTKHTTNLVINDSIIFSNYRTVNLPFNGELITITYPSITVDHSTKCLVILQTKQSSIILPCPLFDDNQSILQNMTIKRSMNGIKRTYIKPNSRNKILYTFRMDRQKSLEFRQFYIDNFNSSLNSNSSSMNRVVMTNFKGEVWAGYITIDPTFVKKGRWGPCVGNNEVNVAFEFEGYKLN